MHSADGTVTMAYNGEVYNLPELRKLLESLGYTFRSGSDTEAVIALYQRYGNRFPAIPAGYVRRWLCGMRQIIRWCWREDRFGEKTTLHLPGRSPPGFRVGDQGAAGPSRRAAPTAHDLLSLMLGYGYIPAPLTFLRGFRCCRRVTRWWCAGSRSRLTLLGRRRLSLRPTLTRASRIYWTNCEPLSKNPSNCAIERCPTRRISEAAAWTQSDRAYMTRHTSERVKTFAIGFIGETPSTKRPTPAGCRSS